MRVFVLIAMMVGLSLSSQAQTTVKIVSNGCFSYAVEELTIDEENNMSFTTNINSVKDEFKSRTGLATEQTDELISNLIQEASKFPYNGLCTAYKTISITQNGLTQVIKVDGCAPSGNLQAAINELFRYEEEHFVTKPM